MQTYSRPWRTTAHSRVGKFLAMSRAFCRSGGLDLWGLRECPRNRPSILKFRVRRSAMRVMVLAFSEGQSSGKYPHTNPASTRDYRVSRELHVPATWRRRAVYKAACAKSDVFFCAAREFSVARPW